MIGASPDAPQTAKRKDDHIEINLNQAVQALEVTTGFEQVRFVHQALPDINLADVSTRTTFLGMPLAAPILVSAMTGGTPRGWEITRRLAVAAQAHGLPLGVGSQRAAVEDPERARFFRVRDVAPDIFLLGNLGAVQLNLGYGVDECRRVVEMIDANALVLHLNPLQEALQAEGDTGFGGLIHRIEEVCRWLEVPVVVKEIGCGISGEVARRLSEAGVAAIDVGGAGGTSWSAVEHFRATDPVLRQMGATFAGWGIPTAASLCMVREAVPDIPVIASGGLRNGLDAAKALAYGATLTGFAGPFLRAADAGEDVLDTVVTATIEEVRLAMFCTGVSHVDELAGVPLLDSFGSLVASRVGGKRSA
jgi:isopentenyl-diphosphate delta-isomerase